MPNLTGRPGPGLKAAPKKSRRQKQGKVDLPYLDLIRQLPCIVCLTHGLHQTSRTTAHHVTCGRYSQDKEDDRNAIPLCDDHHQGQFSNLKIAFHRERSLWIETYGEDTDYLELTARLIADKR